MTDPHPQPEAEPQMSDAGSGTGGPGGGRGQRERAILILVGLFAALGLAAFLLLRLTGSPTEPGVTDAVRDIPDAPVVETPPEPVPPPEVLEFFEGRDPFRPVIFPPAPPPPPGAPMPTPTPTPDDVINGRRVSLLEIFEQNGALTARVDVNGTQYTVTEGDTFAENFRLERLTEECGNFTFGDEGFTLCVGEEVLK